MKRALLLIAAIAHADTITTRDSHSWNGRAATVNGVLTLTASFRPGARTLPFAPDYLRSIEFNSATFNPGSPPAMPVARPGKLSGIIYFRDRGRKESSCPDIAVLADRVMCGSAAFKRDDVLRIVFSH